MSGDVFISYASQDKPVADAVCAALESAGVACWIAPRDVTPGEFYADSIVGAINASRVLVVVLTQSAVASPHVLREVERASAKRHPVVTFRIDAAPLPAGLEYFLSASHWLDATSSSIEGSLPELARAVQRLVAPQPSVELSRASDTTKPAMDLFPRPPAIKTSLGLNRPFIAVLAVIAMVVAYLVLDRLWLSKHAVGELTTVASAPAAATTAAAIPENSVAVLPFLDLSERKDQEYFSDGLSEQLIDMLVKIPDLRVPARTSSFYFKGKSEDIPTIGRRLLVAHVLEGSVRKSGRHLRVTAQLVRADNGYHLWSETYDRQMDDVFKVQDEIAAAVVKALKISLADAAGLKTILTKNVDAYALYLQGRDIDQRAVTAAEYERAAETFRKSTDLDPAFAGAWFGLEIALIHKAYYANARADAAMIAEIRRTAEQVVALDPSGAYAHQARAQVYWNIDWNWVAAAVEYRTAFELNPREAANSRRLADANWTLGNDEQAVLTLYQKAIELDPVNPLNYGLVATYYDDVGRFADEQVSLRKAIDLNPTMPGLRSSLGATLLELGRPGEAFAEIQREPDPSSRRFGLALAYCTVGRKAESDAALEEVERNDAANSPYRIAQIHTCRGELDRAFVWLDRAYRQRDLYLLLLRHDRFVKKLRPDPRYKALLRKLNLPE